MKKQFFLIVATMLASASLFAQQANYWMLKSERVSSTNVRLSLIVYGKQKKNILKEAQCAALRIVLFDGCPETQFSKALMDDGEQTVLQKYPSYFENLYNNRYSDFISNYVANSAFKKADKNKGTEYIVEVKVLNLRKDLEKNDIRKKIGL
jgi:hypothetical protein